MPATITKHSFSKNNLIDMIGKRILKSLDHQVYKPLIHSRFHPAGNL